MTHRGTTRLKAVQNTRFPLLKININHRHCFNILITDNLNKLKVSLRPISISIGNIFYQNFYGYFNTEFMTSKHSNNSFIINL